MASPKEVFRVQRVTTDSEPIRQAVKPILGTGYEVREEAFQELRDLRSRGRGKNYAVYKYLSRDTPPGFPFTVTLRGGAVMPANKRTGAGSRVRQAWNFERSRLPDEC